MIKLHKYDEFAAGAAAPMAFTTTYRVVSGGTAMQPQPRRDTPMPRPLGRRSWLRRQHPADLVRIVLLLAAIAAVVLAVLRLS